MLAALGALLVAFVQPATAQTSPQLRPLEQRLAQLATENPGEFGFAALDLGTGEMVSFNGDRAFPMASTMKIAVAAAYLAEVDAGRRRLDETIGTATALSLLETMLIRSNNHSTDVLIATLGGPAVVDGWLRAHRLSGIRVDRNIARLLADRRDLHDIRDSSTPMAMLQLLRLIDSGDALSPRSRALLLDMMRRCATGRNRIRGLMPSDALVEHKTGTLNGYTGDVGYLTRPDGQRLAVVFFARGGDNRPAVISTAARAIYDGFGGEGQGLAAPLGGRVTQASTWQRVDANAPRRVPGQGSSATPCTLRGSVFEGLC
ncbi:MAG TPA: serine hydrolase [Allosphingosinicella sp.]|nr:serine hydrolase [Allosphingosinicella sp.]